MSPLSRSIVWRTLLTNAAVLGLAFVLLTVTPVTVSARIQLAQVVILLAGMIAMVIVNWLLLRRALAPLRRLTEQMEQLDLNAGPLQVEADSGLREIDAVSSAFTTMTGRLAEERRATALAALAAQERERLRVSRELHDEIGQSLIAIALEAERAAEQAADPAVEERFTSIAGKLHFNLDELRRIARELRPETLDDLGLSNALIALANGVREHQEMIVERRLLEDLPELSGEAELVVYRVAQEALANAARHSGAASVQLCLRRSEDQLVLSVVDDGRGLADDAEPGAGIQGMRERALLINAKLAIESPPGGGTRVELAVPLEGEV